jgi:hypothetical protein
LTRVYFTDRDLGKQFPAILTTAGVTVERHGDLFSPQGSDEEWLQYCGTNGRVAITHNRRIRYVPNELAAVMDHHAALIVVIGNAPFAELAKNFVNTIAQIEEFLDSHEPPFIAKVYRPSPADLTKDPAAPGTISLWYPK